MRYTIDQIEEFNLTIPSEATIDEAKLIFKMRFMRSEILSFDEESSDEKYRTYKIKTKNRIIISG